MQSPMAPSSPGLMLDKNPGRVVDRRKRAFFLTRPFDDLMRRFSDVPSMGRLWKGARSNAFVTALIGWLGLIGWFGNIPFLAQAYSGSVLIATRAAFLFLVMGLVLFYYLEKPVQRKANFVLALIGVLSILVSLLNRVEFPALTPYLTPILLRNID